MRSGVKSVRVNKADSSVFNRSASFELNYITFFKSFLQIGFFLGVNFEFRPFGFESTNAVWAFFRELTHRDELQCTQVGSPTLSWSIVTTSPHFFLPFVDFNCLTKSPISTSLIFFFSFVVHVLYWRLRFAFCPAVIADTKLTVPKSPGIGMSSNKSLLFRVLVSPQWCFLR